jgi:Domain of unknown function (DUF1995)
MLRLIDLILAFLLCGGSASAFVAPLQKSNDAPYLASLESLSSRSTNRRGAMWRRNMISNLFGSGDGGKLPQLPRDVKEAVSRCREATQAALKDRISRIDIEFPVGTKFGVEKGGTAPTKRVDGDKPTREDLDKSDRELARIFVEMFQPVGGENLVVTFNVVETAEIAKKQWEGDPTAAARILSMDRRESAAKKKKAKVKGFAAKLAAEIDDDADESGPFQLPSNTEVALFVAPGPRELVVIERICESVGMGTLVILLNARLSCINNFGSAAAEKLFLTEFEPVFNLAAAPQDSAPGCLLHCAYGKDWILARKPAVGQPKTILVQDARPTSDECKSALGSLELSEVEKNVESAMENVANWFR